MAGRTVGHGSDSEAVQERWINAAAHDPAKRAAAHRGELLRRPARLLLAVDLHRSWLCQVGEGQARFLSMTTRKTGWRSR